MKKLILALLLSGSAFAQISGGGGGAGTVSGTTGKVAKFTGSSAVGDSLASDDGTTFSYSGTGGISSTGSNGGITFTEGTGAGLVAAASKCIFYADSTAHVMKVNCNNGTTKFVPGIATAATSGNCAKFAANGIDIVDNGSACASGGATIICQSQQQAAVAGTGSANNLYTCSIPGGTITQTNGIRVEMCAAHSGANTVTFNLTYGASASISPIASGSGASIACSTVTIFDTTSTSNQQLTKLANSTTTGAGGGSNNATGTTDSTALQTLAFTASVTSDNVTPIMWLVTKTQ